MKSIFLLFISLFIALMLQAQVSKTLNVTAGNLKTALTAEELNTITNLTLTGTIDGRDFKTMRDNMSKLSILNLSSANITKHSGTDGPTETYYYDYPENTIPPKSFSYLDTWQGKTSLTSVVLPESLKSIGFSAFAFCTGLISFVIPPTVTSIEGSVFYNCSNLTSITLPSNITSIEGGLFYNCIGLTSVNIPPSVTKIGDGAFYGCKNLKSISIPSAVNIIESLAFYDCKGLTSITIPASILVIGRYAFENCSGLTSIFANSSYPVDLTSSFDVFSNIDKANCTLYVPNGSKERYAIANQWKDFKNIIEMITGLDIQEQNKVQSKCYPNPFIEEIAIEIANPKRTEISVDIYNIVGERIKDLAIRRSDENLKLKWNGTNDSGQLVAPGVYICKVNKLSKQLIYQGIKVKN